MRWVSRLLISNTKLKLTAPCFTTATRTSSCSGLLYTGAIFGNLPGEVSIPESRVMVQSSVRLFGRSHGLMLNTAATIDRFQGTGDYRTASPDALYGFQPSPDPSCPPGSTIGSCGVNIKGRISLTPQSESTRGRSVHLSSCLELELLYRAPTSSIAVRHFAPLRPP